jgi:predicted signal transduction protein with EAL and GGDEF domain
VRLRLEIVLILSAWVGFIATHQIFLALDFFWLFWWADILLHTAGGALVVASWYTVDRMNVYPRVMRLSVNHPLLVLVVMMVGWEIFEYAFGIANTTNYVSDTMQDFICGGLGGLVVYTLNKLRN